MIVDWQTYLCRTVCIKRWESWCSFLRDDIMVYIHCILMYCHLSFGERWQTYGEYIYNYFAWMYKYCAPWLNRLFSLIFAVQPFHWNTAASKRMNDCVFLIMFMYYLLFGHNSYVTLELLSGLDIYYLDIVGHRWWNLPIRQSWRWKGFPSRNPHLLVGPPRHVCWFKATLTTVGFMVDISVVRWGSKPTYHPAKIDPAKGLED